MYNLANNMGGQRQQNQPWMLETSTQYAGGRPFSGRKKYWMGI